MWRTGSTYLASRFARSDRYLLFYEPCHEYVGDLRQIRQARAAQTEKQSALRHPDVGGGYFDAYELKDPLTGRSLSSLYAPSAALRDVYNDVSGRTVAFLEACVRAARAQGRVAVFGFCRSGTAQRSLARAMAGERLYLWRDPREQFDSYGWPTNDYFLPGTILQLLGSAQLRAAALNLADGAFPRAALALAARMPDRAYRQQYRLGRALAKRLTPEKAYSLFYLSWLAARDAAATSAQETLSLTELATDMPRRAAFERRFAISLDDIQSTPVHAAAQGSIDHAAIEARVATLKRPT